MFKGKRELPDEYKALRKLYSMQRTDEGRLRILRKMLKFIPSRDEFNKVKTYTTHLIKEVKERLKKKARREEAERKSRQFFKNEMFSIALIGDANTGKTRLLNELCNTNHPSTIVPYESKKPVIGVFDHQGVRLRVVEVPSAIKPEHAKILRECDLIIVMPKSERFLEYVNEHSIETPLKELESHPTNKWSFLDLHVVKLTNKPLIVFKGTTLSDLDLNKAIVNGQEQKDTYILKDGDIISNA